MKVNSVSGTPIRNNNSSNNNNNNINSITSRTWVILTIIAIIICFWSLMFHTTSMTSSLDLYHHGPGKMYIYIYIYNFF
jgi:hypothetical protein